MMDDSDLDDAALWAVIDSAAASRSRKPLLAFKTSHHHAPPRPFRNPRPLHILQDDNLTPPADGEVVQEELGRPYKIARYVDAVSHSDERRMVVLRQPQRSPMVSPTNSYLSPEVGRCSVREVSPFVESPQSSDDRMAENKENLLGGRFSSVSAFKEYQNVAMAILDKSDYTMISGKPYIKKTGWRKISCFFNLSFEIKDKSIEFDDKKNVQRAEFVVRAHMQSGRFSDGWGSCERREKNFLKPNHDIPSTAETRAKNKACQDLLGLGEVRPGVVNGSR